MSANTPQRGRPVIHTFTARQEEAIIRRLGEGQGAKAIARDTGYDLNGVQRVRRHWVAAKASRRRR